MEASETKEIVSRRAPRLATVLIFLAAFSIIGSYLAVYAVTDALVAAHLMSEWTPGADPRARWLTHAFFGAFGTFATVGGLFWWFSRRQLRRIDAMADGDQPPAESNSFAVRASGQPYRLDR